MKFLKLWLWTYAIVGTTYFAMYKAGAEVVVRYAVGPLWFMMVAAPIALLVLLFLPALRRMAALGVGGTEEENTAKTDRILRRRKDLGL